LENDVSKTINRYSCVMFFLAGKNDGAVQGVRYFTCRSKHGIFVRADKLIRDSRGRALRQTTPMDFPGSGNLKRCGSRGT